jgi:hypothetical protein
LLHELALLAGELAARCREPEDPDPLDGGLEASLAVVLANNLFRLGRGLEGLEDGAEDSREVRKIRRAYRRIEATLRERGVEWWDPCGEIYDVGRLDFERLGSARPVAGLDRARIGRCERPAVLLAGELLQTARGVVEEPSSEVASQ